MKPIVLLLSSNSTTAPEFINKIRSMNMTPVVICKDRSRFPFIEDLNVLYIEADEADRPSIRKLVREISMRSPIAGVMSTSEYFQADAAELAASLGLPALDPASLRFCRNKGNQRRRLEEAEVQQPAFRIAKTIPEAIGAYHELRSPVVLKPIDGTGSVGVQMAAAPEEVERIATNLLRRTVNERGLSTDSGILIEQFVSGDEFSIEVFNSAVVGVTAKLLGHLPWFVEVGHTFPADIPASDRKKLEAIALKAVAALRLHAGPVHVEAKLVDGQPYIIEVNARLAGGNIPRLVELTGVDLIGLTVQLLTNRKAPETALRFEAAAIRFVVPSRSGTLVRWAGIDTSAQMEGVVEVGTYKKPGDAVRLFGDFRDRYGHVIAVGHCPTIAAARAESALREIQLVLNETGDSHE